MESRIEGNQRVWSTPDVVRDYVKGGIEVPEALIFAKYRERIVDKKILDLGCGAGRTAKFLRHMTDDWIAVDYAEPMIEFCKRVYRDSRFRWGDARDLSQFSENEFDFILFAFNGIDSLTHEERLRALRSIHRILKPGGLFVFSAHNKNDINARFKPCLVFSGNPFRQIKFALLFLSEFCNYFKNKPYEVLASEYWLRVGRHHNFRLLVYYIDRFRQANQLYEAGFEVLEMYGAGGERLEKHMDDSQIPWIYYVARKK